MNTENATPRRTDARSASSYLSADAVQDISSAPTTLLADVFALYLKTKNFHWHMSGPHFSDYHLLLDEHGEQIFAITDAIAERVRKVGGTTLHSIGQIARLQRVPDNDADYVTPSICWPSCSTITNSWRLICGRRTRCATSAATLPPPACSRPGSMKPKAAPGSCSKLHGRASGLDGGSSATPKPAGKE